MPVPWLALAGQCGLLGGRREPFIATGRDFRGFRDWLGAFEELLARGQTDYAASYSRSAANVTRVTAS